MKCVYNVHIYVSESIKVITHHTAKQSVAVQFYIAEIILHNLNKKYFFDTHKRKTFFPLFLFLGLALRLVYLSVGAIVAAGELKRGQ